MMKLKIEFNNFYLFSVPVNFDIAPIKILFSNHLIVRLKSKGQIGIGEGVLYKTACPKALNLLKKDFPVFFQQQFSDFKQIREVLYQLFTHHPGMVCAFDLALWDLEGKLKKKPVYRLLAGKKVDKISLVEQIFIPQNKVELAVKVKNIIKHKTKTIKLKAGRNLEQDIENIKLIKKLTNNKVDVQLDLNKSLNFNQAIIFAQQLKKLGVTTWEEPIKFTQFKQLRQLKKQTGLTLILDESIQHLTDLQKAIKNKAIDILNVKISRLGGLTNSLQLIRLAEKNKIAIEIGCSEELGVATVSQLYLAAGLRSLKAQEGLGAWRLGFDLIKEKQKIFNGFLLLPEKRSGLGVNFSLVRLKKAGQELHFPVVNKFNQFLPLGFYANYLQTRIKSLLINGLLFLERKIIKP